MFASDAAWNGQAAYNARGAQWDNAAIASTDAWQGNVAAAAAATPAYYGRGYGYGAGMW